MKTKLAISLSLITIVIVCGWRAGASQSALVIPLDNPAGVHAEISLGLESPLGLFTIEYAGATKTYSDGNYQIQVTETPSTAHSIARIVVQKSSREPFRLNGFSISAQVTRSSIQGIWYPGANPSSTNVMATDANHSIEDIADANYGIPYLGAASLSSRNVFAMGLGRQDLPVSIVGQPAGASYEFHLNAPTARSSSRFEESVYFSTDPSTGWMDIAEDYADWVDRITGYHPFPVSARAYEPLYDAWYWSGDRVDEDLYLNTAKLASDAGMGLYLADSGWDTAAGEYAKWLAGRTGDYSPPPQKFGNLPATFDAIRSEDKLGIDLWLQPFAVGRESARYPETRDIHIQLPQNRDSAIGWPGVTYAPFTLPLGDNVESVNLCPRMSSTQQYLRDLFSEVATKYKPQGYWLDFIDGMATYCVAPHHHDYERFGDGFRKSLEAIKDTILANDPQAIVHFRARYANLNTKPFANIWQSGDSPGNYDQMRLTSIRLRPFSKGVVFASDQLYWPEGTSEVQVAKFIITSIMTGVPAFGPTLIYSPPETLAMLKAWLSFYRSHQVELATGKFSTFGLLAMPNHKIESSGQTFAYIRNLGFSEMAAQGQSIFLMNATGSDRITGRVRPPSGTNSYSARVFSRYLIPEPHDLRIGTDTRGLLNLNIAVEQGGMLVLTPIDTNLQK